jgi:hypothetical protein
MFCSKDLRKASTIIDIKPIVQSPGILSFHSKTAGARRLFGGKSLKVEGNRQQDSSQPIPELAAVLDA